MDLRLLHRPGTDASKRQRITRQASTNSRASIRSQPFPRSQGITEPIRQLTNCFIAAEPEITSTSKNLTSNEVLEHVRPGLERIGFRVESGKSTDKKISVPVLFGLDNRTDKSFNADAVSHDGKIVLEVEAGRAVDNNQSLKDIFQACMMFEVEYLVIAVRNTYRGNDDFTKIYGSSKRSTYRIV